MKLFIGVFMNLLLPRIAFSELMELKCDEIKAISYYERYYGTKCTISDVSADSSSTFVIRSANNFEYNKIIQEVEFSNSKLYDMPREIFGTFQFLKKVQANSCGIEDVNKYNFNYASALQELRMRSNKIKKLPNSVFSSITTLTTLDLSSNEINEIEKNAFVSLESLEYLTLSSNKLVELGEDIFKDLTALISIRIDNNKLQIIEENLFANCLNLSEIRIEGNEIAVIKGDAFGKLKDLILLNVASNRLHEINIKTTNVERLWIPYNNLKSLDVNKNLKFLYAPYNELEMINFTGNTEMMELKLRQNSISDLSNISSLTGLEVLDLSYNPLGPLKVSSFARMHDLIKLNLEFTQIKKNSLTYGTFSHNTNLTQLDLSYNQLLQIDFNIFSSLAQLTHLKVDGNNLTEIPFENIKVNFPKLSLISLTDNDWNCSYLSNMIKQLRAMNVIVYVFTKYRVYDEMNVDGIRCHNNATKHVYWRSPIAHLDDNEANLSENDIRTPETDLNANLTKIWDKISELQIKMFKMNQKINNVNDGKSFVYNNHETQIPESVGKNLIVQSEVSSIKVILYLMFFIMMFFMFVTIIKFVKSYGSLQRFYYPNESFRRSTATIQTTMEHVM
ncbi:CLUMA_CG015603, isoform A [Clunio marinus]|uniref:CLUMA_CG015603, isoform A n=1 Tax=Clunio marinus TaxID=568069 RepID=A0A1J1IQW0_9DIPT|nr:CLUMA_CG015603, isoform A [Clunio marinus]